LLLALLAGPLRGDDRLQRTTFPDESTATADRLRAAAKFADDGQMSEAVEEYHHILEEAGNKLVPLDRQHLVRARWLCHLGLSRLPPEGLRLYRGRVDGQARKWFEQGTAGNDETLLRRVVEEAFCSSVGDQALERLGDLAFERGRFEEAVAWWRRVALPAGHDPAGARPKPQRGDLTDPPDLVFPDPHDPTGARVASVRAKQLLARALAGGSSREALAGELAAFRTLHGKAEGHFAGRRGNYAVTLEALLSRPEPPRPRPWLTFAGDPSRNLVLPPDPRGDANRLLHLIQDGEVRSFHLGKHTRLEGAPGGHERGFNHVLDPAQAARSLAFHPLIVGQKVLVADARYVTAYDAVTGQAEVWYDLLDGQAGPPLKLDLPALPDLRYTLTAGEDCVLARLGTQYLETPEPPKPDDNGARKEKKPPPESFLVCLNLRPDAKGSHFRWEVKLSPVDRTPAVFEGAPVVAGGRAYIAATHVAGGQTITEVHCYPLEARLAAPLRWKQRVCATPELRPGQRRYRHHLLTLAGPNLVYCSHSGAVVALDAASGRLAWALRYPGRGTMQPPDKETVEATAAPAGPEPDQLSARDLAPCLYAGGRLYVAPADYDRLLCLDPATGRVLWEREKIEVVHLLGVGNGRLIFTTRPYYRSPQTIDRARATPGADGQLWAVNAATGSPKDDHWEAPNDGGGLVTFGRGLLAGDVVLWPTYDPTDRTGHPEHWKVLDQRDGTQPADLIPNGMDRIPCGNLALGEDCLAVAGVEELTIFTSAALLRGRREKKAEEQPQSALSLYQRAVARADAGLEAEAFGDLERVPRLDGAGDVWQDRRLSDLARQRRWELLHDRACLACAAGRRDEAADLLKRATAAEFPTGLRLRAARDLAALWAESGQPGKSVVAWQSVLAEDALRRGYLTDAHGTPRSGADTAQAGIDELIRTHGAGVYEAAERETTRLLAEAGEGAGRREVLSRLATEFPNAAGTAPALLELARAYAKEGRRGLAAHSYRLYLRRPEGERLRAQAQDELARLTGVKTPVPGPPLPLERGWGIDLEPGEQLLPTVSGAGSARRWRTAADLFFARGRDLVCRAAGTGKTCWSRCLPFVPAWAGLHADLVLAGGPGGIQALTSDDGSVVWEFRLPAAGRGPGHFRLAGERLFFLEDERRLFALDAETGRVLWAGWAPSGSLNFPAPGGRFTPRYHAGADFVTLQTSGGSVWVLDAKTGRRLHERDAGGRPWPRAPLPLDDRRLCVVPDAGTVAVLEPASGKELARAATGRLSTLGGTPPLVAGDAETLLVLSPRNYGSVLCCFDPLTGKARWAEERLVGREPVAPGSLTVDRDAAYLVCGSVLSAHALADGRTLWSVPLPDGAGDWQTCFVRDYLAVYPGEVGPGGWELRGPFGAVRLAPPGSGERSSYYSVLLLDPKTGELVQRLNLGRNEARPLSKTLELQPRRQRAQVQMLEEGVAVSLDGEAWGRLALPRE
jgi:outer membrane protein assembly factor BamB